MLIRNDQDDAAEKCRDRRFRDQLRSILKRQPRNCRAGHHDADCGDQRDCRRECHQQRNLRKRRSAPPQRKRREDQDELENRKALDREDSS